MGGGDPAGTWQGPLSRALVAQPDIASRCTRDPSPNSRWTGGRGHRCQIVPLGLVEPLGGDPGLSVWGVERLSLGCHPAWPRGACLSQQHRKLQKGIFDAE